MNTSVQRLLGLLDSHCPAMFALLSALRKALRRAQQFAQIPHGVTFPHGQRRWLHREVGSPRPDVASYHYATRCGLRRDRC